MKITRASDYAIRLLAHLAKNNIEVTSQELANKLDIPFNHIAKLVQILARRGYLLTRKGKGGGLRLAMDPAKIDLAEVVEAVEGPLVISDCILHRGACRFSAKCRARKCFAKLREQMRQVLAGTSIYDLVPSMQQRR